MESSLFFLVAVIAGGLFLLWMILYFIPIGLWFQALVSDVKISLLQLVLMRWRKVPPTVIVRAMIEGKKAGLELYRDLLEAHYLAGVAKLVDDQLLAFYTSLYLMGVNGLSVNVGTDQEKRVQLKDLVVRQNMKEAGEGKMIVENPEMHLTAIYLMQELRHQTGGEVTDQIKELQEELLAHYQKGTFLISVQEDGQIPVLKQKDGSMYQPIFTDILEFRRFAGDKKLKMLAIPSAKIPEALIPDARGVVINPLGVNVQLTVHRPKKEKPEA